MLPEIKLREKLCNFAYIFFTTSYVSNIIDHIYLVILIFTI